MDTLTPVELMSKHCDRAQELGFMSTQHMLDCMSREQPLFIPQADGSWSMERRVCLAHTYPPNLDSPSTGRAKEDEADQPMTCADAAARLPNVGAQMQLKSGGPAMTVVYADCTEIGVSWFDQSGNLCTEDFHPECLQAHSDEVPF